MIDNNLLASVIPHGAQWAIEETAARQLINFLQNTDAAAHRQEFESAKSSSTPVMEREGYTVNDGVAFINLSGPMTKAPTSLGIGASTVMVRRALRSAMSDDAVKQILMIVDSPGGSVSGTNDLAMDVAMAASKKPCYSYIEDCACSAAYWVAAQSSGIFANQTSMVGSIGTYMVVQDSSKRHEKAGIDVHVISTGTHKGAGMDGVPITEEQLAEYQAMVNSMNEHFLDAVCKGRGMSRADLAPLADGRVWIGQDAVNNGLVDSIATLDQVHGWVKAQRAPTSGMRAELPTFSGEGISHTGLPFAEESTQVLTAVSGLTSRMRSMRTLRTGQGKTPLSGPMQDSLTSLNESLDEAKAELAMLSETFDAKSKDSTANLAKLKMVMQIASIESVA